MIIKEVLAKTILSKSRVLDYSINPYIGCEHACTYCYARYMKRFTGHKEKWGEFVDVKVNADKLLQREVAKKRIGRVWFSGICDPYQPIEKDYELTRKSLLILSKHKWPVIIQTKSSLIKRDIKLLSAFKDIEVGLTITTADEKMRRVFEPNSPTIEERIDTLASLWSSGLKTFVMIAPILPKADGLVARLRGKVNRVLVDRMNYHYADSVYRGLKLEQMLTDEYYVEKKKTLADAFSKENIPCQFLF